MCWRVSEFALGRGRLYNEGGSGEVCKWNVSSAA